MPSNLHLRQVDPLLVEVWEKSLVKPVIITLKTRAEFQRLRYKLYETRKILEAKDDPLYLSLKHLSISSSKTSNDELQLTIGVIDDKIRKALQTAGFGLTTSNEDLLDPEK